MLMGEGKGTNPGRRSRRAASQAALPRGQAEGVAAGDAELAARRRAGVKPGDSTLRRCTVCRKSLAWPSVEFCSPACSEDWVRRHREKPPVLSGPAGKGRPPEGSRRG